jgi:hypothetical protein
MPQQLDIHFNTTREATPEEIQEWQTNDFFMAGKFDPLKLFVVVPTIIQITCVAMMGLVMWYNDKIF